MGRVARVALAAFVVVALLAFASPAGAGPVRIFAVGNKQRIADAVTYGTYHDKMAALMDRQFPRRDDFVQQGVDDVASHLRPSDPSAPQTALVVFPEDVGLVAALIGTRGAAARQQTTAAAAIGSLAASYEPQVDYYAAKYPGQPPVRTLMLALTDTLYRSFYETFRELARDYGVYVAATINAAPARRVEAAADPALVALLRDPDEPSRSYAYEAVSPRATNTTFVFAPDGEVLVPDGRGGTLRSPSQTGGVIRSSTEKAYLTPIEQPPPGETASLHLAFGAVRDMEVLDTPAGRLGIVISKDAWMPDVNDRFAAKGANVILQPEAFSSWAYDASPWSPDNFKEGGFATLQKIQSFLVNVDASMTGNFFDVTFDGQSAILGRKRKADPGPLGPQNAWIGQNPDTGFLSVAPWIEPDPGIADPALTLADRRALLAADGRNLLPGSGVACPDSLAVGACENGYREAIVWTDVTLPEGPVSAPVDPVRQAPPRFTASTRVSGDEPTPVAQHAPRVAAAGSRVYAVWHEARAGRDNVWLAVSRNRGASFGRPIRVSDNPAGSVAELNPSVAADGSGAVVAWQEFTDGRSDDRGRVELARFDASGAKLGAADIRVDDADGSGKWMPSVALSGGTPVVAWIDERDRGPEGEPLERVYAARQTASGQFGPSVRVDAGEPVPLAAHLDNKWSPTIAATPDGGVYVAWADFRDYSWDIFASRSADGGRTFGPNTRINDAPSGERIDERPTIGVDSAGGVHAAWTDLRDVEPDTNVFYARSDDRGASFSANRQLDDSRTGFDPDRDTPSNQWSPSLASAGDRLFVAWQDNRLGNNDIFFATSADRGASFTPSERVDDTGSGVSEQTLPQLAWSDDYCFVAWEDNRNGQSDIYLARRKCPA
jgi:predicted amidohydrolase